MNPFPGAPMPEMEQTTKSENLLDKLEGAFQHASNDEPQPVVQPKNETLPE